MPLPLPTSLSPSKVSSFTDCGLAFRFSAIDRLPEPPSVAASRGTLVHARPRAAVRPGAGRAHASERPLACLDEAIAELRDAPGVRRARARRRRRGRRSSTRRARCSARYFRLEDPRTITPIGLELKLEVGGRWRARSAGSSTASSSTPTASSWSPTTRPARRPASARSSSAWPACAFYSLLCERLFGKRPARGAAPVPGRARRHHLRAHRSLHPRRRAQARRHLDGDRAGLRARGLPPNPGRLCDWCAFKAYCPAFGGDLALADAYRIDWELAHARRRPTRADVAGGGGLVADPPGYGARRARRPRRA